MKFHPGDVVQLNSSFYDGGPSCTVLNAYPPSDDGAPARYDLAMMAKDGAGMLTFTLPEFALTDPMPDHS